MGNKPWADENSPSPLSEFCGWLFASLITTVTSIAWIPIKCGMNPKLAYGVCVIVSVWFAITMAREAAKERKEKQKQDGENHDV